METVYYTPSDIAKILQLSTPCILRMISTQELIAHKVCRGGRNIYRIEPQDLQAFLDATRTKKVEDK